MAAQSRVYWLSRSMRVRRERNSLRFEPLADDTAPVRVPVTDVAAIVAAAPVDVNSAAVSLLGRHGVVLHLLDHYGNYAGCVGPAESGGVADVVFRQVDLVRSPGGVAVARSVVVGTAANVRRVLGGALDDPLTTLKESAAVAESVDSLRGIEGAFRRSGWAALDASLPTDLQLSGRSRRPPRNAGNAFVSFVNGLCYAKALSALRCTPLHPAVGFLHTATDRRRFSLALDLAEVFKPFFAERLLLRAAGSKLLRPSDFVVEVNAASLSEDGRRKVLALVREELDGTVKHRALGRRVSVEELWVLEAYKLLRVVLEGGRYRPVVAWW